MSTRVIASDLALPALHKAVEILSFFKENKDRSRQSGPVEVYATDPGILYHEGEGFRRAGPTARRAVRKGLRVDKESILSSLKSK